MNEKDMQTVLGCIDEHDRLGFVSALNNLDLSRAKLFQRYFNEKISHCIEAGINSKAYPEHIAKAEQYMKALLIISDSIKDK